MSDILGVSSDYSRYVNTKIDKTLYDFSTNTGPFVTWLSDEHDFGLIPERSMGSLAPNTLTNSLWGFSSGIACLLSHPNNGKTTLMVNMMMDGIRNNEDLVVIDISLDDPFDQRLTQYICCLSGLTYQEVSTPSMRDSVKNEVHDRAVDLVREFVDDRRLYIFESEEEDESEGRVISVRSLDSVVEIIRTARKIHPDKKIAVFIDSWSDVDCMRVPGGGDLSKQEAAIEAVASAATACRVMVFTSVHRRKEDEEASHRMFDVKGSVLLPYRARWVGGLYNHYVQTGRNSNDRRMMLDLGGSQEYPVLAISILKNKTSSWTGTLFYVLMEDRCKIQQVPEHYLRGFAVTFSKIVSGEV